MKNYNTWNHAKQNIDLHVPDELSFHEREIWWCSIGINIGDEQDGKNELFERPILVFKKFNNKIAWVLPMTSKYKEGRYYYAITYNNNVSTLILSQLRLLSSKRFCRFVRKISDRQFEIIQSKVIELILCKQN